MPPNYRHFAIDENDHIVWYYDKKARDAFMKADPRRRLLVESERKTMRIAQRRTLNNQAQEEDRYNLG